MLGSVKARNRTSRLHDKPRTSSRFKAFQVAIKVQDIFKKTLVLGLISTFALSVFINIGVVTGLVPTKGLTMPFMSYGGSSLLVLSILFGMILNIEMSENQSKPSTTRY